MTNASKGSFRIGDYAISITPEIETSDDLDTEANRERARRAEEDAHAAQHGAGRGGTTEGEERAQADVDASIAAARANTGGDEIPILVRDPVTGAVIRGG
ncbi:MAG: hypothetical protein QM820_24060 [Minicystis sp.]